MHWGTGFVILPGNSLVQLQAGLCVWEAQLCPTLLPVHLSACLSVCARGLA